MKLVRQETLEGKLLNFSLSVSQESHQQLSYFGFFEERFWVFESCEESQMSAKRFGDCFVSSFVKVSLWFLGGGVICFSLRGIWFCRASLWLSAVFGSDVLRRGYVFHRHKIFIAVAKRGKRQVTHSYNTSTGLQ